MKNFKGYFILALLLCTLSISFILCACQPNNNDDKNKQPSGNASGDVEIIEPYSIALTQFYSKDSNPYITDYFDDESKLNLTAKINSLDDLKAFCQEKQWQIFAENNGNLKSDNVCVKLKSYDEEFFKTRSIVLVLRLKETKDFYSQCAVDLKDNEMTINLMSANGNTTMQSNTQIKIFEISKETAQTATQIKVTQSLSQLDKEIGINIYEFNNMLTKDEAPTSFIIRSVDELNTFCDETTSPYFEKNSLTMQDVFPPELLTEEKLNDPDFIKAFDEMYNNRNKKMIAILKQYDEEFFKTNSLVLLFRFRASSGYFYRLDNYQIDGDELSFELIRKLPSELVFYPADATTCIYVLEINKEKVENITQINVNEIEEK